MHTRGDIGRPRGFVSPPRELGAYAAFGFFLPNYRRRGEGAIRRVPTARATLYFARDVCAAPGDSARFNGVFCEGPRAKGFDVPAESSELVAVKVSTGGLRALLGVPARELRDRTVSLDEVWGRSASLLTERLLEAKTTEARYRILEAELVQRSRTFTRHDDTALRVARIVERRRGQVSIDELCRLTGMAQRTLLVRFDEWVGVTPKQLARASRLRAAIARIGLVREVGWADLALECGYCDQAHLIHEFRDLLALTPNEFLARRRQFSPKGAPAFGRHALPLRERELYRNLGMVSDWSAESANSADSKAKRSRDPAEIYNPPHLRSR